jgi:4-hydroxy-3-methylbut-2-enyl diphosphate reductase
MVGRETIPVVLGEKPTLILLKTLVGVCVVMLALLAWVGEAPGLAMLLAVCPTMMGAMVLAREKGHFLSGLRYEFAMESIFVLAGVMGLVWALSR